MDTTPYRELPTKQETIKKGYWFHKLFRLHEWVPIYDIEFVQRIKPEPKQFLSMIEDYRCSICGSIVTKEDILNQHISTVYNYYIAGLYEYGKLKRQGLV